MKGYNPHQEQITLGKKQLVRLKRMQQALYAMSADWDGVDNWIYQMLRELESGVTQALEDLRSSVTDWGTYDEYDA